MSIAKKEGPESKDTLKVSRSSAESKEEHPVESCRTSESLPPGAGAIELEKEEHNTVSTTVHGEQGTNADGSNANETPGPDGPGVPGQDEDAEKHEKIDLKMLLIILSLMLAVFCVALDNTIIAVAIPKITDEFERLDDSVWYLSAYLLTTCALQLFYSKLFSVFNIKWVFLSAVAIFEIGSLICGVAKSSTVLIISRAISGIGCGGIFMGALLTLAHTLPLERRPIFMGGLGGMYGIACVGGPLLGGLFTDKLTWRWCFFINLPVGGVAIIFVSLLIKLKTPPKSQKPVFTTILEFDPAGTVFFITGIISLLLGLQWGGVMYPWSNWRVILLFALGGALLVVFSAIQIFFNQWATVPGRVIRQRSIIGSCLWAFTFGGSFFTLIFYIPIWFQAIQGQSAVKAGVYMTPLIVPQVAGSMLAGAFVTRIGYYAPLFIAGTVLTSIGAGLFTLWSVDAPKWQWIVFQAIYGFGAGLGMQQPNMAAQTVLPLEDVPIGTALVVLSQVFGGTIIVSVAQNVFTNRLIKNLVALDLDGINPEILQNTGATALRKIVPADRIEDILVAYNDALIKPFEIGLILACLTSIGAALVEWRSIKGKTRHGGPA